MMISHFEISFFKFKEGLQEKQSLVQNVTCPFISFLPIISNGPFLLLLT
jgi:hypothetical protein